MNRTSMQAMNSKVTIIVAALGCSNLVMGCGGGDSAGDPSSADASDSASSSNGSGGTSASVTTSTTLGGEDPAACPRGTPLFSVRYFDEEETDLIRAVRVDPSTEAVYFSIYDEIYRLGQGSSEPEPVIARPTPDVDGAFWLVDERALFPSGFQAPIVDDEVAVLFATPLDGGEAEVVVGAPSASSPEDDYLIQDVLVVGDEVVWIGVDMHTDDPADLLPEWESRYFVRKTSWRNPSEPVELYASGLDLSGLLVVGDQVFVDEALEEDAAETRQLVLSLDEGTLEGESESMFGGVVKSGDADSLIVSRLDFNQDDPSNLDGLGLFVVDHDGEIRERVHDIPNAAHTFGSDPTNNRLVLAVYSLDEDLYRIQVYDVQSGLKTVGCVDDPASVFALEFRDGEVLVATHDQSKGATIVSFPNE